MSYTLYLVSFVFLDLWLLDFFFPLFINFLMSIVPFQSCPLYVRKT